MDEHLADDCGFMNEFVVVYLAEFGFEQSAFVPVVEDGEVFYVDGGVHWGEEVRSNERSLSLRLIALSSF